MYLIVGGLALVAALGSGHQVTDERGALRTLFAQPFGDVLLGIVAIGLLTYAGWRFVQAVFDADRHGTEAKAVAIRAALFVSGLLNVALAAFAGSLVLRLGAQGEGSRDWTPWLLQQPFGPWLVAGAGIGVIAAGIALAVKGVRADFRKRMRFPGRIATWANPVSRAGLVARGLVMLLVGGFLVAAALGHQAGQAQGLRDALTLLQQQSYGWALLALAAAGLFAFGIYSLLEAAYREIRWPTAVETNGQLRAAFRSRAPP